ncbi:MAG: hypothetical protein HC845_13065 [Akkermansiaceae bacterium]|nr:hypothetical protein [Akkermansiaceae bacterium]
MQTVMEIEDAIGQLPDEELFRLIERLENKAGDVWDRQFENDVRAGLLDSIAQRAIQEHRAGQSTIFSQDAK